MKSWFYYVAPFALFMLFTVLGSGLTDLVHIIYALKTITVGLLLYSFRSRFSELKLSYDPVDWLLGFAIGLLTLLIWIAPEELLPPIGEGGFDPYSFGLSGTATYTVIFFRIFGASVVVPVMEELFWRSFLSRYLIDSDFLKVPLGRYTVFSFVGTAVCFGFEHRRIVVGIIAGLLYNLLLLKRKNLFAPILAHATTNLGLSVYVLATESYGFW